MQLASADRGQRPGAVSPLAGTLLGILQPTRAPPVPPPALHLPRWLSCGREAGIPLPECLRGNQSGAAGKAPRLRSLAWEAG